MAKKLTIRQQYLKEVKKIEQRYIKAVGKGFVDTKGRYSDEYGNFTWKIPKRIGTRELKAIKKHSQNYLYENMSFFHPVAQKFVSGKAGAEYIRSESGKKGWQKRKQREAKKPPKTSILEEYRALINSIPDEKYIKGRQKTDLSGKKRELIDALTGMFEDAEDKQQYLKYLESMKDNFAEAIRGVIEISESEGINQSHARALSIIEAGPISIDAAKNMEESDELPY